MRAQQQQVWLNRQADLIERAFSSLSLPVRVNGGQVREGRVRYHLTALGGTRLEAAQEKQLELAGQLGAQQVRIAPETGGLTLEVTAGTAPDLRLLPLMQVMGDLPPRTGVIGMTEDGRPLTLCLSDPASQHLLIGGPLGSGKSELLRAMLFSLALTSRPAQLQMMGIDLSGRELTCLEALPHALTDVASEPGFALELLEWLSNEIDRRRQSAVMDPAIVLLLDDLDQLPTVIANRAQAAVRKCLLAGAAVGIHVLLTTNDFEQPAAWPLARAGLWRAQAGRQVGKFEFRSDKTRLTASAAWIPAPELPMAVEWAQRGPTTWVSPRLGSMASWSQS